MPRWISLLSVVLLVALGGAADVWAETLQITEAHETLPLSEAEPTETEEEEATADARLASDAPSRSALDTLARMVVEATCPPLLRPPR